MTDSCVNCKFVGTYRRPRIVAETGFGDQLEFSDVGDDETVYTCRAPSRSTPFVGTEFLVPRQSSECAGWANTSVDPEELERRAERKAHLDRLVAASAARAARDDSTPRGET